MAGVSQGSCDVCSLLYFICLIHATFDILGQSIFFPLYIIPMFQIYFRCINFFFYQYIYKSTNSQRRVLEILTYRMLRVLKTEE